MIDNIQDELESRIQTAREMYGSNSLLVCHYLYYQLAWFIEKYLSGDSDIDLLRSAMLEFAIQWTGRPNVDVYRPELVSEPSELYNFPQDVFVFKYGGVVSQLKEFIVSDWQDCGLQQTLFDRKPFVVGPHDEWRQSSKALSARRILAEPALLSDSIAHPIIAADFDQRVKLAGEIAFSSTGSDNSPRAIIINNLSGHYLPRDWTSNALIAIAARVFTSPTTTTIVGISGNDIAVCGPLSEALFSN